MEQYFQVDAALEIPIYRQLVDKIRAAVKKGELQPGDQLPTVQELADRLSVAKGTIKRAYDELGNMGILEKVQGRGTFICYQPANSGSRKEQAMGAIDELLDKLEDIGFSQAEINIFLNLKLRERTENLSAIKVAVLECNPENLSQLSEQLRKNKGIEIYSYLLDSVSQYPYRLDEEMDLFVTSTVHAQQLLRELPDVKKLARVAVRLTEQTVTGIAKLPARCRVGILTCSERFGELLAQACRKYNPPLEILPSAVFDGELDMDAFLSDKDAVLVPQGYEKYCTQASCAALDGLRKQGKLICCAYEMDEGSAMYLEERIQAMKKDKMI